jgi:hypothetical protein
MRDETLSRAYRVVTTKAAAVFADPFRRGIVLSLAGRPHTLGELAGAMGVDLKRLHYHVGALTKLRLVVVAGLQRRAGRPSKLYRAVGTAFFVPQGLSSSSPGDAMMAELREAHIRLADPLREGMLYSVGEAGEMTMRPITRPNAGRPAAADCWRVVKLTQPEAMRLAEEMDNCLKAAVARSRGPAKLYLVHYAFAPRQRL